MNTRRTGLFVAGILFAIVATYAWAWLEGYARANRYFAQAMTAYARQDWAVALKGSDEVNGPAGAEGFTAGLEQVVGVWKSAWAWPKPPVYYRAKAKLETVIERLSPLEAQAIVEQYLGRDNEYLPQILWRIARLHEERGETDQAREAYALLAQGLRLEDPELAEMAAKKLDTLGGDEGTYD